MAVVSVWVASLSLLYEVLLFVASNTINTQQQHSHRGNLHHDSMETVARSPDF